MRPVLLAAVCIAWIGTNCPMAAGSLPVVEQYPIKSIQELFAKSDVVAAVWMTAGLPEGIGGPWHVVRATVDLSFKGAPNDSFIFFRCFEECTLGQRYLVFLKKEGHTLGQLEKLERHVPLSPFPLDAIYFIPTSGHGFAYPVFYEPQTGRKDFVVGLFKTESALPTSIQQGSLTPARRSPFDWWASYDQLREYLLDLAHAQGSRHP